MASQLLARSRSGAVAAAEPTSVGTLVGVREDEVGTTDGALPLLGSLSTTFLDDEDLVISYEVVHATAAVAAMAARNEIGQIVVHPVLVKMIDHQSSATSSRSWHPLHGRSAPVAGMRTPPDRGEEDMALRRKSPVAFLRERMSGFIDPEVDSHQSSMTTMGDGD